MAKRSGSSLDGSLPATKRTSLHDDLAACPPLSLTRLAQAGQRNYDEKLQFDVVSTDKPSRLLVVGCKTFHWHPPYPRVQEACLLHALLSYASQLGGPLSVCVIVARACHVTSQTVYGAIRRSILSSYYVL